MYKLIKDPITGEIKMVKRIDDNAFIPFDPANTDYANYLEWLAAGNVPEATD